MPTEQELAEKAQRESDKRHKAKIRTMANEKTLKPEQLKAEKEKLAVERAGRLAQIIDGRKEGYKHLLCSVFRAALDGKDTFDGEPTDAEIMAAAKARMAEVPSEEEQRESALTVLWREEEVARARKR